MVSKKSTKKALLSSVICLILCVSMLVGTTFAWFTDSVSSGNNSIVAGNLDVEVYYDNDGTQTSIENVATLFDNVNGQPIMWEPGAVAYENITVVNEGTLALKYGMAVNFSNENTVEGYGLSQVLKIAVVPGGVDTTESREEIVADIENWQTLSVWYESGKLLPEEKATEEEPSAVTYGVVIWWEPSADDNNWNVSNNKVTSDGAEYLHIDLGINVTAWQLDYEEDSFDKEYDANLVVTTVEEANERIQAGKDIILFGANEPSGVIVIPEGYTGVVTLNNVSIASVQAEENADLVIEGVVNVTAVDSSAITAKGALNISGSGKLTAIAADVKGAFGIGGLTTTEINIKDVHIVNVKGSYAWPEIRSANYGKDEPEGGAAIGSGSSGAVINLTNVIIDNAKGGSKAAGIGARFWTGVEINITNSVIKNVVGGNSSAGIGGSRVSDGATSAENVTINIVDSTITAQGGEYGAGIGSGYDVHCQSVQPICTINISGNSVINATGGKYAAGVGTGYHNAGLAGEITDSVAVNAASGDRFYKASYTTAMDIGFGVTDPTREGQQTDSKLIYNGAAITLESALYFTPVSDGLYKDRDGAYHVANADGLATLNTMMVEKKAGKNAVVNLISDIDFSGKSWTPVDSHADTAFYLKEINGNGHTISNLTVNGQAMFTRFAGFGDVVIKDITFENATVNNSGINTALIVGHTYQNTLLDNVDVKNSSVTGGYKVATLVGTVYNEDASSSVTLTVNNCDVDNCTVTTTSYDFMTCGLVAFVYVGDNDRVVFDNTTISNVKLVNTKAGGYNYHAFVYYNDQDTDDCFNEADGVTVTNCTFIGN